MAEIHAGYNGDLLPPKVIEELHAGLLAELNEMGADAEAGLVPLTERSTDMTAQLDTPGLWEIHSGRVQRTDDGNAEVTTTVRQKGEKDKRPSGSVLIGWAGWLLAVVAAGALAVSYTGQFAYIYAARHQVVAADIEAGMFDVGMVIFAVLGLGLAFARKPSRIERVCVMACSIASAGMNYAAADVNSPRSVAAYVAPPVFLALVIDRVIAVVRRHRLGDDEGSPWAPLGRAAVAVLRLVGLVLLYALRFALDRKETWRGLRQAVLNAAPLPSAPAEVPQVTWQAPQAGSKKEQLITLYRQDRRHGDRALAARAATDLAPRAGLQAGTARTYINEYLVSLNGQAR
jgi:hypothetical protein